MPSLSKYSLAAWQKAHHVALYTVILGLSLMLATIALYIL
jgi:hypothetical protein